MYVNWTCLYSVRAASHQMATGNEITLSEQMAVGTLSSYLGCSKEHFVFVLVGHHVHLLSIASRLDKYHPVTVILVALVQPGPAATSIKDL